MTETLLGKLAEHGITGILLVICFIVIYYLYGQLSEANRRSSEAIEEVQKLRIEDQKAWQAQYVELIKACTAAIVSGSAAASAGKEAMTELRDTFKDLSDEIRRMHPGPGRPTDAAERRR